MNLAQPKYEKDFADAAWVVLRCLPKLGSRYRQQAAIDALGYLLKQYDDDSKEYWRLASGGSGNASKLGERAE